MEKVYLSHIDCASVIWFSPAISVATWFEGKPPIEFLLERINSIISVNPWLTGRLKKKRGQTYIKHSLSPQTVQNIQQSTNEEQMFESNVPQYGKLSEELLKFCADSGDNSCNRDIPLFRISLTTSSNSETNRFILVISMCHAVGDARSLYQIIKMLNYSNGIVKLNLIRDDELIEEATNDCGALQMNFLLNSKSLFVGNVLHLLFDNKTSAGVFGIDTEVISCIKRDYQNHCDDRKAFISTNDILTSWLGREFNSDFYVMSINMLNRKVQSLSGEPKAGYEDYQSLFGNYTFQLLFRRGEYESPSKIREIVGNLHRRHEGIPPSQQLPSLWECMNLKGYLVLTNWSGVYEDLSFENCRMIRQIPIYPTCLLMHIAVIFRMNQEGDLAVLTVTYPGTLERFISQCSTPSDSADSVFKSHIL